MAGDQAHVRQIAQQAMQNISQLLEIIGSDGTSSSGNLRGTHSSVTDDSSSTVGSSRPRPRQGQQHGASSSSRPVSTNITNRYHPYAQHNSQRNGVNNTNNMNNNQSINAVSELRRRFPTAAAAAGTRRPSSANFTGRASRGRTPGRPFASSTVTRDVMVLKAGEETVPSRAEKSQLELDGRIITGFDVNRSWEQEQLFKELEAILPDEYKGIKFQIMKNCHGNLVPPNIPQGKKIDAQLLLRSLAPSTYIYIQLLHEPIPDDILDVPAFELLEEIVTSHDSGRKADDDLSEDPSNMHPVGDVHDEKSFIVEILQSMPENLMDPVEILKYLQQKIVTGRALEISSVDTEISGETNYVTVDRENIMQTTFDELQFICNPRLTFQVDFMGEDSADLGGPRKEWIRLLNREIKAKYFDHDLRPLLSKDYFYVGQVFAIALLQNGQIPSLVKQCCKNWYQSHLQASALKKCRMVLRL